MLITTGVLTCDFVRLQGPGTVLAALPLPFVVVQVSEGASPSHKLPAGLVALEVHVSRLGGAA